MEGRRPRRPKKDTDYMDFHGFYERFENGVARSDLLTPIVKCIGAERVKKAKTFSQIFCKIFFIKKSHSEFNSE